MLNKNMDPFAAEENIRVREAGGLHVIGVLNDTSPDVDNRSVVVLDVKVILVLCFFLSLEDIYFEFLEVIVLQA